MILNQQIFDIKIIDETNGDLIAYFPPQQVVALKMEVVNNGIGSLVVTFPFKQSIWDSYKKDRLIEVSTINYSTMLLEKEETFFLRKREVYLEGDFKQIAFGAVGLEDLFNRRMVKPTTDDINNAGGFVTRSGTVGTVLEEFSNEQMINPDDSSRKFFNLTYNKISEGEIVGIRTRYTPLIEVFDELRVQGEIDYKIERISDNDLEIQVGVLSNDYTYDNHYPSSGYLLFSPEIGNAINPTLTVDAKKQRNYVYVLGEGEGSNQKILEISGDGTSDSIYNKIEIVAESRKGESSLGSANQQALTTGINELNKNRSKKTYKFDMIENRIGYQYRVDWDIGDLCTFVWEDEIIDFEINKVIFTVNGDKILREIDLELKES